MLTKSEKTDRLLSLIKTYAESRSSLLDQIGIPISNRDPLSEFAERLVASCLNAELAPSRVQKGWDLKTPDGAKVQVKFLANPREGDWVNEHWVQFSPEAEFYSLVVYRGLLPESILIFDGARRQEAKIAMGCRNSDDDAGFHLTECRYDRIVDSEDGSIPGVESLWFGSS